VVVSTWLERSVNLLLAVLALLLLSPVLFLIAMAVKLTSRGPVLYTQERIGLDRRNGGP
jgi:lipopolysaccharide/colanic/teichoic acid biosynthesis glycosyltransferase